MSDLSEIIFLDIEENSEYSNIINKVLETCFNVENILNTKLYVSVTLTTPSRIKELNNAYRNVDKPTDVLSFPMFEKNEINEIINNTKSENEEILGDIVISIDKVKKQAIEYGHSFDRELAYMVVHGFYHLMGEDHIEETEKIKMRKKEERVLEILNITR